MDNLSDVQKELNSESLRQGIAAGTSKARNLGLFADDKEYHACGASSSKLPYGANGIDQIPFHSECRIGAIFLEGEAKHGRDDWKRGAYDESFHRERLMHVRAHLQQYLNGDKSEDHLAKVAWGCIAVMELQRLQQEAAEEAKEEQEAIAQLLQAQAEALKKKKHRR